MTYAYVELLHLLYTRCSFLYSMGLDPKKPNLNLNIKFWRAKKKKYFQTYYENNPEVIKQTKSKAKYVILLVQIEIYPATFLCMSQARIWISNAICRSFLKLPGSCGLQYFSTLNS